MEVRNHIIAVHDGVQQIDKVEQRLLQVDVLCGEPFPAEHNHRPAQAIHAALVQTTDA